MDRYAQSVCHRSIHTTIDIIIRRFAVVICDQLRTVVALFGANARRSRQRVSCDLSDERAPTTLTYSPVIDELISNQLLLLPPSTTRRLSGVADDMFASRRSAKLITDIEQCIRRLAIDHPIDIDRMRLGGEYRSMIDTRTFLELIAEQKLDVVLESLMHRLLAEFQNSQAMIE